MRLPSGARVSQLTERSDPTFLPVPPQVLPFPEFHSTAQVVFSASWELCLLSILDCVATPPPFLICNLGVCLPHPTAFMYKSFCWCLLVFFSLFFLHLYAVCVTVWLASPFCSLKLRSDQEDRSGKVRMFLIGRCFQVFEMKSSKCYHFPFVRLHFTLHEDDQFSKLDMGEEGYQPKFLVRD